MATKDPSTIYLYRQLRPAMLVWLLPFLVLFASSYIETRALSSPLLISIANIVAGAIAFCMIGLLPAYVLFFQILRRPAITVTSDALLLATTTLHWHEIAEMRLGEYAGTSHIFIALLDQRDFLAARPNYVSEGYRRLFKQTGNYIVLPLVRGHSSATLLHVLQNRWSLARNQVSAQGDTRSALVFSPNDLALAYGAAALGMALFAQWFMLTDCIKNANAACFSSRLGLAAIAGVAVYATARFILRGLVKRNPRFDLLQKVTALSDLLQSGISGRQS